MSYDAYELWYDFLNETDPDTWSEKTRKDFSGVLTMNFDDWFREVKFNLFTNYDMKMDRLPVHSLREGASTDKIDFDTHLVLVIDLSCPASFLMERVESRIKTALLDERKAGRPEWKPTLAKYPFCSRPDVAALRTTLHMHKTKKANPNWPNWKVGQDVQQLVEASQPILRKHKLQDGDQPAVMTAKKKMLEQVTTRYLKNASALLNNVAQGIFPSTQ